MLQTRVLPCLLLRNESLVKSVRFKTLNYVGDAINTVRIFNQMEVDELILLDILATTKQRKPDFKLIEDIASECFMPIAYGGGIHNIDDAKQLFSIGLEKICVNSTAHDNPKFIRTAADQFGSQSIVVSIDVKKTRFGRYEVMRGRGSKRTRIDPVSFAIQMERLGAGELLLTSIDRDGTWDGYDISLLKRISNEVDIPVIAAGGAGKLDDFRQAVYVGGASAVAAGSFFFYQGKGLGVLINYPGEQELERTLGARIQHIGNKYRRIDYASIEQ